jgi:hypothetical protein
LGEQVFHGKAAVATYIRNRWGNAEDTSGALDEATVAKIRAATATRSAPYTEEDFQSPRR